MPKRKSGTIHHGAASKPVSTKDVRMHKHHRLPRSRGGSSRPDNLIVLSEPVHKAWHYLFGNANAEEVASMITDMFIDAKFYLVAVPRKRKAAKHRRTRCMCTDCGAEVMKLLPKTQAHDENDDMCDCRACYALGDD